MEYRQMTAAQEYGQTQRRLLQTGAALVTVALLAACTGESAPPQPTSSSSSATRTRDPNPCNRRQELLINGVSYGSAVECVTSASNLFYIDYNDEGPDDGLCVIPLRYLGIDQVGYEGVLGSTDFRKVYGGEVVNGTAQAIPDTEPAQPDCDQSNPTRFYYSFRRQDTPGNVALFRVDPEQTRFREFVTICTSPNPRPVKPAPKQRVGICKAYAK